MANEELDIFEEAAGGVFQPPEQPKKPENVFQYIGQTPAFQAAKEKTGEFLQKEGVVTTNPVGKKLAGLFGHAYDFLSWDDKDWSGKYIQAYEDELKTGEKSFRGLGMPFALLAKLGRETTQFVFPETVAETFTKIEMERPIGMDEALFALAAIGLDVLPIAGQALKPALKKAVKHTLLEQGLKETPENITKATKILMDEGLEDINLITNRIEAYDSIGAARVGDPQLDVILKPDEGDFKAITTERSPLGSIQSAQRRKVYEQEVKEFKQNKEINDFLADFNLYKSEYKRGPGLGGAEEFFASKGKNIDDFLTKLDTFTTGNDNLRTYLRKEMGDGYINFQAMARKRVGAETVTNKSLAYPRIKKHLDDYVQEYKKMNEGAVPSGREFTKDELVEWLLAKNDPAINNYFKNIGNRWEVMNKLLKDLKKNDDLAKGFNPGGHTGKRFGDTKVPGIYASMDNVKHLSKPTQQTISDFIDEVRETIPYEKTRVNKNIRTDALAILDKHMNRIASHVLREAEEKGINLLKVEDDLLTMMNKVDKNKLGELLQKRYRLQSFVEKAKDWDVGMGAPPGQKRSPFEVNLSHIKAVTDDWRTALDIDNLFFAFRKSNVKQESINKNINNALKEFSEAKTLTDKKKVVQKLHGIEQDLIDEGVISEFKGIRRLFGAKDVDTEAELMKKIISKTTGLKEGGVVKRALGSPEEGEMGSGIAGDDPYFDIKTLDLDLSPFEGAEDLDIFEEARKGGAQEYQTANLLLPFLKLFGKAPKHEIVPIPTPKKDLTKQTKLQKQSLDKEKEKIIAADELEVFDPSPDVRLEGAVLPEGVPPVATTPITGEPMTSVFYADIEKILARPDAPKKFEGHWRTNKETGEKEWVTPKDEIWDYFNLHHIRKSEASDYRIPQLLKMFDDEAVITADQIIKQVRNAPITGVKVHGTGHKSGFMNMSGKDIEAKFADQHMEPGYIPGTYGERVLVIPRSKLPGDTGKYPTAFSGENVSYHRFGEGDDEYVIAWTRNSDRMAIVPSKVEGPKIKTDTRAVNRELKKVQSEMNGLVATAGRRIGLEDATLDDILANSSKFQTEDLALLKQINELDIKQQKLMSAVQDAKLPDTSGVVKVRFADEIQSDLLQVAAGRKQKLAATLRQLKEENQVANDLASYNDINSKLMKFYEKNESVFRPLQVTGEELNVFKTKIDEMDTKVNEVVDNYVATREISDEDLTKLSQMLNDNLDNMLDEILVVDSATMDKLIPDVPFKNRKEWADALMKINLYEMAYDKFVLKNPNAADWFVPSPGHFISNRYGFKGDTSTSLAERYADKQRQIQAFKTDGSFLDSQLKGVGVAEFYGGPGATAPKTWRIIDKNQPIERKVDGRIEKDFKTIEKGFTNIEDATKAYDELGGRGLDGVVLEEVPGKHYTSDIETILKKQAKDNNSVMEVLQVQTKAGGSDVFRITDQNGNMVATLSDKQQAKELIRQNPNYNIESIRVPSANTTTPAFGIKITEEMLELYPTHKAQGGLVEDIDIFEVA